jgi:hypothetical protein
MKSLSREPPLMMFIIGTGKYLQKHHQHDKGNPNSFTALAQPKKHLKWHLLLSLICLVPSQSSSDQFDFAQNRNTTSSQR